MSKLNLLKPDLKNLYTYVYTGSFLILISSLDVFLNSFFDINITSFLPQLISFILPLIIGLIGLHFIRIEFTGIKKLDLLNKHINTNNFNAILTLLVIFIIIKSIPPMLDWFILEANFVGNSKDDCTGDGACCLLVCNTEVVRSKWHSTGDRPSAHWRQTRAAGSVPIPLATRCASFRPGHKYSSRGTTHWPIVCTLRPQALRVDRVVVAVYAVSE